MGSHVSTREQGVFCAASRRVVSHRVASCQAASCCGVLCHAVLCDAVLCRVASHHVRLRHVVACLKPTPLSPRPPSQQGIGFGQQGIECRHCFQTLSENTPLKPLPCCLRSVPSLLFATNPLPLLSQTNPCARDWFQTTGD